MPNRALGTSVLSESSRHRLEFPLEPGADDYSWFEHGTTMATTLVAGCPIDIREDLI